MLDPKTSHVDNSNFLLFDPFRNLHSSHLDKAKRQTRERHDDWEEGEVELKLLESEKEDDSGIQSPPLWKNYSPIMHHHHPLSPNSRRREAIVRGQRELMDMVKNLPESCYELSLKDLVEHIPPTAQNQQESLLQQDDDDDDDDDQVQSNSNRQGSKKFEKKRGYSVDLNNNKGLFLKMVFPVGNRTRKSIVLLNSSSSSSSKGSSKLDGNGKTSKSSSGDKYWWKKRFSMSSESESSRSSSHSRSITSSSSSSSRSTSTKERRSVLTNCMICFQSSKDQATE